MTEAMSDGPKTTTGEKFMRVMAFGLITAFATTAMAAPAAQELAGVSRAAPDGQATLQPAPFERRAEPLAGIVFGQGSAKLTPSGTRLLDGLGHTLSENRLRIESHAGADKDLAARRANAVVAYLEQNCGVTAARLEVVTAARADDRRVWVQDLGR